MGESNDQSIDRRTFLKTAAVTGAAAATTAPMADAAAQPATQLAQGLANPAATAAQAVSAEEGIITRPGSDFMVDVIKTLGIDYVASNPASSFRSLHESLINYGGNRKPEWLTALHEESSVAMAHGYAKAAGKPMAAMVHSTVGLQHASMALYNAWCDRVPGHPVRRQHHECGDPQAGHRMEPLRPRTRPPWCATSPASTTSRPRCSSSPSRRCAPTSLP